MHFKFRNVNDAFRELVAIFSNGGVGQFHTVPTSRSTSRNGDVLYIQEPIIITYTHPRERVLFNQARDANPYFHIYEALWMLAGRNDVAPLTYYNSNIANYSDDGKTFNGAYGYRWRSASGGYSSGSPDEIEVDQLRILIDHLKAVPDSRRAVLQMWNVEDDLLKIGPSRVCPNCGGRGHHSDPPEDCLCDGNYNAGDYSKDVCCNTHVYFAIRRVYFDCPDPSDPCNLLPPADRFYDYLDMTVCNRSNDLVWGLLGANVVHFSFLQEYMAAQIGVEVGVYNQITNNCHVYLNDKWQPEKWLDVTEQPEDNFIPWYKVNPSFPLIKNPQQFDKELPEFVERHSKDAFAGVYIEPFLREVAQPMCMAFHHYKHKDFGDALNAVEHVKADDWRIAGQVWLLKRKAAHEVHQNKS